MHRSSIGRLSTDISTDCWPIIERYIGQVSDYGLNVDHDRVSINYRLILGELSARYRWSIGELKAISADLYIDRYIDRLSTKYRSTVDRQSIDYRPIYRSTIGRQPTDISTDISVDVSVESAYSKHDPNFFRLVMYVGQRKILIACKESNIRPSDLNKKDGKF